MPKLLFRWFWFWVSWLFMCNSAGVSRKSLLYCLITQSLLHCLITQSLLYCLITWSPLHCLITQSLLHCLITWSLLHCLITLYIYSMYIAHLPYLYIIAQWHNFNYFAGLHFLLFQYMFASLISIDSVSEHNFIEKHLLDNDYYRYVSMAHNLCSGWPGPSHLVSTFELVGV